MFYLNIKKIISLEKNQVKLWGFIVLCALSSLQCISFENTYSSIPPGIWRGILKLDKPHSSVATGEEEIDKAFNYKELPFNFEVIYDTKDEFHIVIHNDSERIKVDDVSFGRNKKTGRDTLMIHFPVYDTYIKALYEENILEGAWYVNYKEDYSIPFIAFHGTDHRFPLKPDKPTQDIAGRWKCDFDFDKPEDAYPALGVFETDGNKVSGTFQTETGDYRYLDGSMYGDKFNLSCFDGSHAFLFEGKVFEDGKTLGTFYSGKHYKSNWQAVKDDSYTLEDPYNLTQAVKDEPFNFSFKDTKGKQVSLSDPEFKGKNKLVQIIGTWCPNCRDESKFLTEYLAANKPTDLEVIAIAFERYREEEKAFAVIDRYKEKMRIPYPVLYGGYYNKKETSEKFPQLNEIISYPTLLFIDKNNRIQKIHTGFNGPATAEYAGFKKEFETIINSL